MGGHQVRLGAVTALACRGCRIVKFCESFGLGVSHRGPYAADLRAGGSPIAIPPAPLNP
jgi:hypothetical protein